MTYFIKTLGCKVNQYEASAIGTKLTAAGFTVSSDAKSADICIVNTCAVTAKAEQKCRQALHKFRRENPNSLIILTGCMAKLHDTVDGADIVTYDKQGLAEIVCKHFGIAPPKDDNFFAENAYDGRSKAYVKIQDGCDRFCTYCIIPYTRGAPKSKPIDEIVHECSALAAKGYDEVVLCGINMCLYGVDTHGDLFDALSAVADIDGIDRIVLSSLEPDLLTADLLDKLTSIEKLAPQFHISLQSGSDSVLARMGRRYTAADYAEIIRYLREKYGAPIITTDVITGFVGETPEERLKSERFVESIRFEHVHRFPYSVRPGTRAAEMIEDIKKAGR